MPKVSKDLEVTNKAGAFRVVDPAILPLLPAKPNRVIMILFGIFVGILSGIGAVFGLEYLKPSFKDEGSIESLLKVPVLATIPKIITEEDQTHCPKTGPPCIDCNRCLPLYHRSGADRRIPLPICGNQDY